MKIRVGLKDPDGFAESIGDAIEDDMAGLKLPPDEAEAVAKKREEKVWAALEKWVSYNEFVDIEFDTEAGTAVVVPIKQ